MKIKKVLAASFALGLGLAFFSIGAEAAIIVISPNGGEFWGKGTTKTITWTSAGSTGNTVKIQLYRGTNLAKTISTGTPMSSGSFAWKIPALPVGGTYTVRITNTLNEADSDASDAVFNIIADSITVSSPAAGAKWVAGSTATIGWTYKGKPGTSVKIELFKGDDVYATLTAGVSLGAQGKGSFAWAIPSSQPFGRDYSIKVSSVSNNAVNDARGALTIHSGKVSAWGGGNYGQLGNGSDTAVASAPVSVSNLAAVKTIGAGTYHCVALKAAGTVWAWGLNDNGQLGSGTKTNSNVPVQVTGLTGVADIAVGGRFALALLSTGKIMAWGDGENGQLGNGKTADSSVPVVVFGATKYTAVAAGGKHAVALTTSGKVMAWGWNDDGQLGIGSAYTDKTKPVSVKNLTSVMAVSAGWLHSLALKKDGTVWAWGNGAYGRLGNGSSSDAFTAVKVLNLTGVTAIAGGGAHSIALLSDGTVRTWGLNDKGQLGNGSTINSNVPVQVSGLTDVVAVAAGDSHTLAVKSDGTVYAWGWNLMGQLGIGSTTNSATPVQIGTLADIVAAAAGYGHSLVLN